jgi:methionine transaminase
MTTPHLATKFPNIGTTIFTVMSALATEKKAVNLGQGFPDFDCDPKLVACVSDAMSHGLNQYPPMTGVPALREAVADKIESLYQYRYDPTSEITITAGATQAILSIILAVVRAGDEVIVLEPCYDSYIPNIDMAGGVTVRVPLTPGTFRPDFDKIAAAITPKTRAIIVNSPHNPSATVWTREEMLKLQELLAPTPIVLITSVLLAFPAWPSVRSSCRALAKPFTSPAGKLATWQHLPPTAPSFERCISSTCSPSTRLCNMAWQSS